MLAGEADVVDGVGAVGAAPSRSVGLLENVVKFNWDVACLCRYDEIIAFPSELLDGCSHCFFALAASVSRREVEEVYANVMDGFHASTGTFWHCISNCSWQLGGNIDLPFSTCPP